MRHFRIGKWVVRPDLRELEGPSGSMAVEPKSMAVLAHLAEHAGEVVTRQALLDAVWQGAFVTEEVLSHCIWELRRAVGDDARSPRFIKTIPRRGYQLIAPVSWLAEGVGQHSRYELEEEIGSGGMGIVWRATDSRLQRTVALKFLPPEWSRDTDAKDRFLREARAAASLDHPNICTLHEVDETSDGRMFIVMPCYQGETLKQRLGRGPLDWRKAVSIVQRATEGLAAAHEMGLVHRDVKPGNIMLTERGEVKVLDFGIAKFAGSTRITEAGASMGTPSYMSPEQARGEAVDGRGDLWSLGVVLYEAITGDLPFRGGDRTTTVYSILHSDPEPLESRTPGLPGPLQELIDATLAKDREARTPDASNLLEGLSDLAEIRGDSASQLPDRYATKELERSPYPGLATFTREDRRFFFGRDREIETVWARLQRRRLLAIIGPSGAGKSSFLRAGLLPAAPTGWRHVLFHPGSSPVLALGEAMAPELASDPEALRQLVRFEDPDVAVNTVAGWRAKKGEALIVIDQFEELFTLNPPAEQARFAALLHRLVEEAGVRVLLSMRDDFFFACHDFPELEEIFNELTPLGRPTGEALRQVLVEPARRCGYAFEDEALIDEMLAEVSNERGALPLLAFAASRVWERRDRKAHQLTREAYDQIGGVSGALAGHAEDVLLLIGPGRERLARAIFRNLLSAEGTRAPRDIEDLLSLSPDREAMAEVVTLLVDGRLLTTFEVSGSGGKRVEIIHESLLSAWPRLARWQTQDADSAQLRDQLRRSAKLWEERRRPEDLLWTGASFLEFRAWRERTSDGLTASEEAFGTAMVFREGRRRRRRRIAVGIIGALMFFVIVAIGGLWQRSADQARRAEASELVARGQLELEGYPTSALAHALASLELADQPAGRRLAVAALAEGPPAKDLGGGWTTVVQAPPEATWNDDISRDRQGEPLLFTPDGEWLVQGCNDGRVLAWPQRGGERRQLAKFEKNAELRIEPGVLVASSRDEALQRRWSLPELKPLIDLETDDIAHSVGGVVYGTTRIGSGDSSSALLEPVHHKRVLRAWPLQGGDPRTLAEVDWDWWSVAAGEHSTHPEFVFLEDGQVYATPVAGAGQGSQRKIARWPGGIADFTVLADGLRILTPVEGSTRLVLWSLAAGSVQPLLVIDPGDDISRYRVAGEFVVTEHESSQTMRVWSLSDGRPVGPGTLQEPTATRGFMVSPDGRWLAAASTQDARTHLFDLAAPADTRAVQLRRGAVTDAEAVAFHPDGSRLATGDILGVAIWSLAGVLPTVVAAHDTRASGVALSPDGASMLSSSYRGRPGEQMRLGFLDGRASRRYPECIFCPRVAFGPAGRLFATERTGVRVITPANGRSRFLSGFEGETWGLAIDSQGRRVAVGGGTHIAADELIRVWDLEGDSGWPDGVRSLDSGDMGYVTDLAFLPDGTLLAASAAGLQLWDVEAATFEWLLDREQSWRVLGVDESGQILASVGLDVDVFESDAIRVWDLAREVSWDVTSHGNRLFALDVSPDGKRLISGDMDGVVRVGPITGEEPHLLLGHEGMIWDLDVSSDSTLVASAGDDGDLRLWPMPEGRPLHTLPYGELLEVLRAATNLRLVKDETAPSGYELEALPVDGW